MTDNTEPAPAALFDMLEPDMIDLVETLMTSAMNGDSGDVCRLFGAMENPDRIAIIGLLERLHAAAIGIRYTHR